MGSLSNTQQERYVRLAASRRWRRGAKVGFRLCPRNRFSVRRLRAELLTFLGLVGRYVRLLARRLSSSKGSSTSGSSCGRSSSRRVLVVVGAGKDSASDTRMPSASSFMRTNSFYSQAIADCLEFIKRNSVPVEDYGGSDRRYSPRG